MKRQVSLSNNMKIIIASCAWSFAGLFSKLLPWSPLTLVAVRSMIATLMIACYRKNIHIRRTKGTLIGAIGVIGTAVLFMFANRFTSAANAIVLQYAMPIFIIMYNAFFLKELPSKRDIYAIVFIVSGTILCFLQGLSGKNLFGNILGLLSALTYALIFLASKRADTDVLSYAYLGNLIGSLFLVHIPFDSSFVLSKQLILLGICMGICLGMGYLFFSSAMQGVSSPLSAAILANIEPVLNPTWCFIFLRENPGALSIIGAIIVLITITVYSLHLPSSPQSNKTLVPKAEIGVNKEKSV